MSSDIGSVSRPAEFFAQILPEEGWKCIVVKIEKEMRHFWFRTFSEMETCALAYCDRYNVYHSCAAFKTNGSRKHDNIEGIRSLWLDIDCGEGRIYRNVEEAWRALQSFLKSTQLPDPLIVGSGSGLHCYWPLDRTLTRSEWEPLARGLKAACEQHGFHADPARTADASSILRPVGTRNHKYANAPLVACGEAVEPVGIERFSQLEVPSGDGSFQATIAELKRGVVDAVTEAAAANIYDDIPSYAVVIADSCAQVAHFRDTKGNIPEPEWYAGVCLVVHCADGEALAHEWSSGHPNYTVEETDRKLAQAKARSGPTTCRKFESLNPTRCVGCPHRGDITSPIQLGRAAHPPLAKLPDNATSLRKPPYPFYIDRGRLYSKAKIGDEIKSIMVYKGPIQVEGFRKGEAGARRSLEIRHWLPHDEWESVTIPWDSVDTRSVIGRLAARGLNVHPNAHKHMMDFIQRSIDEIQADRKSEMDYEQFGWKGDFEGFLIGRELYSRQGVTQVGIAEKRDRRAQWLGCKGSYSEWRRTANKMLARGAEAQCLALLAGFAAPLTKFIFPVGGPILFILGPTGKGKSLGLTAAGSIWGHENATNISYSDTQNARFDEIACLSSMPIVYDEMIERDPEIIKQFVHQFTQGRDKQRLDISGNPKLLAEGWSTIALSAANKSLVQAVTIEGEQAQAMRIMEIDAGLAEGTFQTEGKEMDRIFKTNYGWAGREFIQRLFTASDMDLLREAMLKWDAEYSWRLGEKTERRFHSGLLALLHAAGVMADGWHIIDLPKVERLIDYAIKHLRIGYDTNISMTAQEVIGQFLYEFWSSTLVVQDYTRGMEKATVRKEPGPNSRLVVRSETNAGVLHINKAYLQAWFTKHGHRRNAIAKELIEQKILLGYGTKNLGAGTPYVSAGPIPVWTLDALKIQKMKELDAEAYGV